MDYMNYFRTNEFTNFYPNYRENLPWILDYTNKSVQYNLNKAITITKDSVSDEIEDEVFYESLIKVSPNVEAREIIKSIQNDEKIHNRILRNVFTKLTGVILPENTQTIDAKQMSYIDGIKSALMGELKAVERYRELLTYMPYKELQSMIFYILTDEIKHANKYNYLIATYDKN